MPDENPQELEETDVDEDQFDGTPVFPPGTSETHRRRILGAMAGGSTVALAGCIGLGDDDEEPEEDDDDDDEEVDDDDDEEDDEEEEPEEAFFDVELAELPEFDINAEGTITATVENTGDETALQDVTLAVEGELFRQPGEVEESVTEELTLDGGETEELELTIDTGAPGDLYDVAVESDDDEDTGFTRVGAPDYAELDFMAPDVAPKDLVKDLNVKVAFNDDEIIFRYHWDQPDPGGWLHDMIYYDGDAGEWRRLADWDPWVLDEDYGYPERHEGYYEDRLSWFWHDGTLETDDGNKPFEQFGGWLTVMEGVRTLPGYPGGDAIDDHPYWGTEGRDEGDMRKYIPQSREGEWWEHDWDDPKPADELDQMLEDGKYIDFPFFRGHRSIPMGYGTNHHVLAYREGNVTGDRTFDSQDWDPEDGPEYMFDPDVVDGGAIDRNEVVDEDGNPLDTMPDQQDFDQYALIEEGENENMVPFDPDVAEWDGAMVPRRPLHEPSESGASWRADGVWEDGEWVIECRRELDTGYVDDMPVEPGETYTFSPALHHGVSQRWHWVAYPLKLALGEDAELPERWEDYGDQLGEGTNMIRAEEVDGEPDWDDIDTYTIPLMYPGLTDWTWLTSGEHPREGAVRDAEINIWEHHDENPEAFAERMIELERRFAPRK